ncbi:unnamed protein product [Moneuplotes crassus]|uniref:Tetratricopeptide repeat protein n=2 Tax=Euplotes crassus TaxID=5936 RepID=A0AAD1U520_EUPCR|nr:unnamed protein product [Moneuplotes crassus]
MEEASFAKQNGSDSTFNDNCNQEKVGLSDTGEDLTEAIYDHIKRGELQEAVEILQGFIEQGRHDKPVYSVISYCYYQLGEYEKAVDSYKELIKICPDNPQYVFYYAQCLFKISEFSEAGKVCEKLKGTSLDQEAIQLLAAISYEKGNFFEAKKNLRKLSSTDFSTLVNKGCIYFKEGEYDKAEHKFKEATKISEFHAELFYNLALCLYEKGEFEKAEIYVDQIIEQAYKKYPQLRVSEDDQVFEENKQLAAQMLRETAIVEAINLKSAILFEKEEYVAAKMTIKRVPAISTSGIDPVTFHNQAIFFVTENSAESIKKMNHLLNECLFPPETFQNLLFLYCKYFFYDLANELIHENPKYCQKLIEKDDLEYISTLILQQRDPKEACINYQKLLNEYRISITNLKSKLEDLPERSLERNSISIRISALTEKYVAVLTNQAKISWDNKDYNNVEALFKESADICDENKVFQVNLAHSVYMQSKNYPEAIKYYEEIIEKHKDNLLKCETIVIANLCVCYILSKVNSKAESLINQVQEHEKIATINDPSQKVFHSCIIHLVIGTLYCSKDMFEFGINLIIKSLNPIKDKLGTDTWYYTKRCFLSLIEKQCKKQCIIKPELYESIFEFLDKAYNNGKNITTIIYVKKSERHKSTVAYEAKFLKKIFLKLQNSKNKEPTIDQ